MSSSASGGVGQAYGLRLRPELELPIALADGHCDGPTVRISVGKVDREPGAARIWHAAIDGRPAVMERGRAGGLHIRFGDEAAFRIAPSGRTVSCAPRPGADPLRWERFLLDTVLWSTALVRGRVALHAAAVADADGAIAVLAGTGAGKSSLALALLSKGCDFVSDDVLVVSAGTAAVFAHPAPPVMNVSAAMDPALQARIGRVIGEFDGEQWLDVRRFVRTPVPLRAVVVLSRSSRRHATRLLGTPDDLLALEAHSVSLPGLPRDHVRTRFGVLADVAARVPVLDVRVPPSLPPDSIADVLEQALELRPEDRVAPERPDPALVTW